MTSMGVEAGRDAMKGLPSALCIWKRLILEYQPLLLRCFDSSGNKTSNPLERFSTGKI